MVSLKVSGAAEAAEPTPRRRDATANREALLRAAQTLLATDANASLDAIAHEAGLSRRALYGHFPDRESLLRAVIAVGAERFNDVAREASDSDPRVALARMAGRLWREASAVRASANLALDATHVGETIVALRPLRARLREVTHAGIDAGLFRRDLPAKTLSSIVELTAVAMLRDPGLAATMTSGLVVKGVLSVVGLGWQEQVELLAAHADILPTD